MATITRVVNNDYNYVTISYSETDVNAVRIVIDRAVNSGAYVEILDSTTLTGSYIDHDTVSGLSNSYRLRSYTALDAVVNTVTTVVTPSFTEWVLKDVDAYLDSEAVQLFVDGGSSLSISSREDLAVFNPIGSKYPIVIRDDKIKSARIPLTLQFLNYAEYAKFDALRHRQKTLKLSGPRQQYNWYVVFTQDFTREVINDVDGYSLASVEFIEVGNL